jgi:hypothetical protein
VQVINLWLLEIGKRLQEFGDDGHGIKQARAIAVCHELMTRWECKPWAVLKGDDVWKKIQHMVVDSLEIPGPLYVRSAGFEAAWKVSDFSFVFNFTQTIDRAFQDIPQEAACRQSEADLRSLQTGSGNSALALASS